MNFQDAPVVTAPCVSNVLFPKLTIVAEVFAIDCAVLLVYLTATVSVAAIEAGPERRSIQ